MYVYIFVCIERETESPDSDRKSSRLSCVQEIWPPIAVGKRSGQRQCQQRSEVSWKISWAGTTDMPLSEKLGMWIATTSYSHTCTPNTASVSHASLCLTAQPRLECSPSRLSEPREPCLAEGRAACRTGCDMSRVSWSWCLVWG